MSKLSSLSALPCNVQIFVPSTVNVCCHVDSTQVVNSVTREMTSLFGGATVFQAHGAWISETHGFVSESVSIVESCATEAQVQQHTDTVVSLAEKVKREMSQESVAIKVNGILYFV